MKINELSQKSGVHLETIRYYEKIGLLNAPKRLPNGYRDYDTNALKQLRFIKHCRHLGLPLEEIKALLRLRENPQLHGQVDSLMEQHLHSVQQKINELLEVKAFLEELIEEKEHSAEQCKALHGLTQESVISLGKSNP